MVSTSKAEAQLTTNPFKLRLIARSLIGEEQYGDWDKSPLGEQSPSIISVCGLR